MSDGRKVIALGARVDDVGYAREVGARVREGGVVLDWSGVEEVSEEALAALLEGLDVERDIEVLGAESASPALVDRIVAALSGKPAAPRRRSRRQPRASGGAAPGTFSAPVRPRSSRPAARTPAWAAPTAGTAEEVRDHLLGALEADLIGPFDPESGEERLRLPRPAGT